MQYRYIELYVDGSGQGFLIRCNGYQLFKMDVLVLFRFWLRKTDLKKNIN